KPTDVSDFCTTRGSRPPPDPKQIQRLLDENGHLIQTIQEYQSKGKSQEVVQYQTQLHRNLVYLATVADSAQNVNSLLPMIQPPGPSGGPPQPPHNPQPPTTDQQHMNNYSHQQQPQGPGGSYRYGCLLLSVFYLTVYPKISYFACVEQPGPQRPGLPAPHQYPQRGYPQGQYPNQYPPQGQGYPQGQYPPPNQPPGYPAASPQPNYGQPPTTVAHTNYQQPNYGTPPQAGAPPQPNPAPGPYPPPGAPPQNQPSQYGAPPNGAPYPNNPPPQNYPPQQGYPLNKHTLRLHPTSRKPPNRPTQISPLRLLKIMHPMPNPHRFLGPLPITPVQPSHRLLLQLPRRLRNPINRSTPQILNRLTQTLVIRRLPIRAILQDLLDLLVTTGILLSLQDIRRNRSTHSSHRVISTGPRLDKGLPGPPPQGQYGYNYPPQPNPQ
ncbi:hypothetical protein NQ317_005201, partial [Molorchus minor]